VEDYRGSFHLSKEKHQSPINFKRYSAFLSLFTELKFKLYDTNISSMKLINNGVTAVLTLPVGYPENQTPYICGSGLFANYRFSQLHFHWGNSSYEGGSEHLLGSKRYAAEMHLVHYNTKYSSFAAATNHSDGLAVVAVFLDTNNYPNHDVGLEKIVSKLKNVTESGDETTITTPLKLIELLPSNTQRFYRYHGSLTTPNFDEIVTWTVLEHPILVSERQVRDSLSLIYFIFATNQ
jgi:carbonic anhydrase